MVVEAIVEAVEAVEDADDADLADILVAYAYSLQVLWKHFNGAIIYYIYI